MPFLSPNSSSFYLLHFSFFLSSVELWRYYCAFQKPANSEAQKLHSQLRFSLPSIIITITSNEPWNTRTQQMDRNPLITNYKPWPFEPVEVNFCFLRGPLRWLTAAENANVSWIVNFRIRVFMKSAGTALNSTNPLHLVWNRPILIGDQVLYTLSTEPFFRLLDFGVLEKDSPCIQYDLCWACDACCQDTVSYPGLITVHLVFSVLIYDHRFLNKRMLALKKASLVWREKTWLTSLEVRASYDDLKGLTRSLLLLNPLSTKSGQHQISPCNINAL